MKTPRRTGVLIIGAGLGGLGLGMRLKETGQDDFVILERADDIGGVWRDNDYPGAACDIPAVLYSYSYEADHPWSCDYPPQAEILDYIRQVVTRRGVIGKIHLNTEVAEAKWDETRAIWRVWTRGGQLWEARALVAAVGIFNHPVIPRIPGRDSFAGDAFHSTDWRHDLDMGKGRWGVIGTGASAIQIVPELVAAGADVTLFQRTAPYVMPKSLIAEGRDAKERQRIFDEFEERAGRRFDFEDTAQAQAGFVQMLAEIVPDPDLRAKLTPDFKLGCKRSLFSNDWYQSLQQPNATVVTEAISSIVPDGVQTGDGRLHPFDHIVYATGFDPANYLPGMRIHGIGGTEIHAKWAEGAEAYLGICVPDFPNFFLMFGPNTNVPGSVLVMLECQADYIMKALHVANSEGGAIVVREKAMRDWCDQAQEELLRSVNAASHCHSYYQTASGRVVTNYPRTQGAYQRETAQVNRTDFEVLDFALPSVG
ncbi:flavin-containing monooxygenase [Paracoccus sp. (in: a-proteobacteria)]|uniref:flavin-containing monooxygenase n=1 Tax=Paracoccus sp. TaxID=267 RepID=UPI003A876257